MVGTMWMGYYQLRKDYIAENHCINKTREFKKCYGSCYLTQKLEETKDVETGPNGTPAPQVKENITLIGPSSIILLAIFNVVESNETIYVSGLYDSDLSHKMLKPPKRYS